MQNQVLDRTDNHSILRHYSLMLSESNGYSLGKSAGRWSPDEHFEFIKGLQKYGKNWKGISKIVKTRTPSQVRTHAQKFFMKFGESVFEEEIINYVKSRNPEEFLDYSK